MRDRNAFPHARVRVAIFWILILTWPALRVIGHLWRPGNWYADAEDTGAALTLLAFLLGKLLFQDTQRKVCERLDQVEQRVHGYDEALSQFSPEPVRLRRPSLGVVRDGTSAARAQPWRSAARGASSRRGFPR